VPRVLLAGLGLTAAVAILLRLAMGPTAVIAALVFGGIATAIEVVAVAALRPVREGTLSQVLARRAIGAGLRLAGIVGFAVAVALNRTLFPPVATAIGYLGVVLPLLYMETWFTR